MTCRFCKRPATLPFIDLGTAPLSNAYLTPEALREPEVWAPLTVVVCEACWLVQTAINPPSQPFSPDYAYFSSYSQTWLAHARAYCDRMTGELSLDEGSKVIEVASNDGYLLQNFVRRGIPCLGIEPTASTAAAARTKGIPVVEDFLSPSLARDLFARGHSADLIVANNVLAHVPDPRGFLESFAILLKPSGLATFEFPHLLKLVNGCQFDTIYHEHYSYLSLTAVTGMFDAAGLAIVDVEELPTHGGSLRVFAQRRDTGCRPRRASVEALRQVESREGVGASDFYRGFQRRIEGFKNEFLFHLLTARREGRRIAAYGAAAKGNTLLNFAGIRRDLIEFVADRNPAKQGKFMPGSRIPIVPESHLARERPNVVVILPWNLDAELSAQLDYVRQWGGALISPPHFVNRVGPPVPTGAPNA